MPKRFILRLFLSVLPLIIFGGTAVFCQEHKLELSKGALKGAVMDSVHNIMLQSATVAIYKFSDSVLINYQLTNMYGQFQFTNLPLNTKLDVVVSYIGYKSVSSSFVLSAEKNMLSLKTVTLERTADSMQEVFVIPPVRLNGDTLEFNAAAFSLDKNAVAEDLLKKLPGVIVWGDGTITVNGKQIKQLLVEGKPFFGDDARIATQNLPKDAIQKVQVYTEQLNPYNPLDSITTVNIKLRSKAKKGHFGEIGAGYGTDKQYEAQGSLNEYSPRDLLGVAAASNNVNKVAHDIYTLMRNNTFKGVSATVDYQPDFSLQGVNQSSSGGFAYQHDFIPDPSSYKQNRLSINSFVEDNVNKTRSNTNTIAAIGNDSTLTTQNGSNAKTDRRSLNLESKYERHEDENDLNVSASLSASGNNIQLQQQNAAFGTKQNVQSNDFVRDTNNTMSKYLAVNILYEHQGFSTKSMHKLTNWSFGYTADGGNDIVHRTLNTDFYSANNPAENEYYYRNYQDRANHLNQTLSLKLGDFSSWLFSKSRQLSNYYFVLKNDLGINIQGTNNRVGDKDTAVYVYVPNTYLSSTGTYTIVNEMPDLNFGRTFLHLLANRFQKSLTLNFDAKVQIHTESNSTSHAFLNYSNHYEKFVPSINLGYVNSRFGTYLENYDVRFGVTEDFPDVLQLRPLVDSAAIYSLRFGNSRLQPETNYELSFKFRHDNFRSKNTFNYGLQLAAGITRNYLGDSAQVDANGRYSYYYVNLSGYRHFNAGLFMNKAMKFGDQQLQLSIMPHVMFSRSPGYIDYAVINSPAAIFSNVLSSADTMAINYTFLDILAVNLSETIGYYYASQSGLIGTKFSNNLSATRFGIGIAPTTKLLLQSSVAYSNSTSTGLPATRFTIWNVNASYRLLKDNSLEMKFSALDILHQNKGIFNYGSTNSLSRETINVLQQYFIFTIAYFPRKFGKK